MNNSFADYVGYKQEENENRVEIPAREKVKVEIELYDLYRLDR